MDPLLAATAVLGGVAVALMLRNTIVARDNLGAARITVASDSPVMVVIDGRKVSPVAYVSTGYTGSPSKGSGESLMRLARSMGLTVTFISSHVRLRKDRLLREIESEMQKAELAYTSTRMPRYRERLKFLEGLYTEVSRSHIPYASALTIIVWVPEGNPDAFSEAEAFKAIVEAELGVKLERVEIKSLSDFLELLAYKALPGAEGKAPLVPPGEGRVANGLVLGRRAGDPGRLVVAEWPRDLEAHGAVVGPTGKGKTVLLAGIAAQLASRFGVNVTVVDPKGDLARLLAGVADRVSGDPRDPIGEGLVVYNLAGASQAEKGSLAASIVERALEAAYAGASRRVVIVDEAWRVMYSSPGPLEAAVREGRSLGLHILYAVQTPHDIPVKVLENTKFYAVFGAPGREYAEEVEAIGLEGLTGILPSLSVGEAIIKTSSETVHTILLDFSKYLKTPSTS